MVTVQLYSIIVSSSQEGGESEHGLATFNQVEPILEVLPDDERVGGGQAGGAGRSQLGGELGAVDGKVTIGEAYQLKEVFGEKYGYGDL